ncbi:MAG: hypothetical protein Q8R32_01670 [bacterium]|nr:hypothetical protein [bacterium]
MRFVLDHAPKGKSYVAELGEEHTALTIAVLKDDAEKEGWIGSRGASDEVFTLFGVSDNIALALYDRSVTVRRISAHRLPAELKRRTRRPEHRQQVLEALARLAVTESNSWYQYRPLDANIAAVRANARCLYTIQEKIRKRAEQFLSAAYREAYLVDPLRRELTVEQYTKRSLAENPIFERISAEEEAWRKKLAASLRGIPIWEKALKTTRFRGLGPSLAGLIIGETGDMRRMRSRDAYVHYCGAHVVPSREYLLAHGIEGELAQRRAGQPADWQARLRQAIWKWSFIQVPKMAPQERFADDFWCQTYLRFKREELEKRAARGIPEEGIVIAKPRAADAEEDEDEENGERARRGQRWFSPLHCHKRACAKLRTWLVRRIYDEWVALVKAGEM